MRVANLEVARDNRAQATVSMGAPARRPANALEIDLGVAIPSAFSGARRIVRALQDIAPATVARLSQRHPAEWDRLFPGSLKDGPNLSDLALSPSERRLHRESEQTFWVLNLVAKIIVEALAESGRSLVIRQSGACDLVSLRALMRALEWARLREEPVEIAFGEWSVRRTHAAELFAPRHSTYLLALQERLRASVSGTPATQVISPAAEQPVDLEGRYLQATLDGGASAEARLAAAILGIRACFFTTNYEGAMLAAEHALAVLDAAGSRLDRGALLSAWDGMDDASFVTPAIEVDRESLGDADELRALIHRQIGVVHSFTGDNEAALAEFQRGLDCKLSAERRGQLHMFRALTLIKRVGNVEKARVDLEQGLEGIRQNPGPSGPLHEGWLRNVYALTYFQEKKLEPALQQEKLAMRCVGDLHNASATHLKINLISNVSVLQESAKQFTDAIATWRRYEKISDNWGPNFVKHHSYRLAGLQLKAGQREEAVANYTRAYASAKELGDAYHRQTIAAELGQLFLAADDRATAMSWFEPALEAAREIGDPRAVAESLAGQTLARGGTDFQDAIAIAQHSSTYLKETEKLAGALRTGPTEALAALPTPRTKLNRPFDLVNLF